MSFPYELVNKDLVTDVKQVTLQLASNSTPQSQERRLYVGGAYIELNDKDYPAWGEVKSSTGWVDGAPIVPTPFSVADTGLGVYGVQVNERTMSGATKMMERGMS